MNILLVYPKSIETFWNLAGLKRFVGRNPSLPPLALLTVAAMLPKHWKKKLVDMNIHELTDEDGMWADYIFMSAMTTHSDSAKEVVARCIRWGTRVVLGGPILESGCGAFPGVSHFLLGEAENTLPEFIAELQLGTAKKIYPRKIFPEMNLSPTPLWELIDPNDYQSLIVQFGRGCPFNCGFCDVAQRNGRIVRTKSSDQFLRELDAMHAIGFSGPVFVADDNVIGNKGNFKEMLPQLISWQIEHDHPFGFTAEVDVTIADDPALMLNMVKAGFKKVFLGLETPNLESLRECRKWQNIRRDMADCVRRIQNHGLVPMSGFIVGFRNDNPDTFDLQMIDFIQETGILFAMVGVLQILPGTPLYEELIREGGSLQSQSTGNNTDCYPNFDPKMPLERLVRGYKKIWETIYSPRKYYERTCVFLREYNTENRVAKKVTRAELRAFLASVWYIGLVGGFESIGGLESSYYYWKTLLFALFKYRPAFSEAVAGQIYGYHFRQVAKGIQKA